MRLSQLLTKERVAVSLAAKDLRDVMDVLVDAVVHADSMGEESRRKLARDLAFGSLGDVLRVTDEVVTVVAHVEEVPVSAAALGISRTPFLVTAEGRPTPGEARCVLLLLTRVRVAAVRERVIPALKRLLDEPDRVDQLLGARSAQDVTAIEDLMAVEVEAPLLVQHALTHIRYRIYPDTPLREAVDLMVRRGLRAVPVVGESFEVLGIITAGDALRHLLPRKPAGEGEVADHAQLRESTARDVMTRSVMCVSEDQTLLEAAIVMMNHDVDQIPVVREGEFVGFLTRDAVLQKLFGEPEGSAVPEA